MARGIGAFFRSRPYDLHRPCGSALTALPTVSLVGRPFGPKVPGGTTLDLFFSSHTATVTFEEVGQTLVMRVCFESGEDLATGYGW
jgi:hypothetical protein